MTVLLAGGTAAGPRLVALDRRRILPGLRAAMADEAAFDALLDGRGGLVSDHGVVLPGGMATAIADAVAVLDDVIRRPGLCRIMLEAAGWPATAEPVSGPLCFDFHLSVRGPRLIEINTNPGGLLLAAALHQAAGMAVDAHMDAAALAFAGGGTRVAIVDDDPQGQFLWPEFLLYRALFRRAGCQADIFDATGFDADGYDAVYNRLTDFRLDRPEHAGLAAAWRHGRVCLTPDPYAHAALSDKRLLVLLSDRDALIAHGVPAETAAAVAALVPHAILLDHDNAAMVWERRRHLFFKPVTGHAAKAVYRGDKISRATWDGLPRGATIAQDFVPPSRLEVEVGGGSLKADFRAFAVGGRVVVLAARLYQGQATNFRTPGGGFAPVFIDGRGAWPACAVPV